MFAGRGLAPSGRIRRASMVFAATAVVSLGVTAAPALADVTSVGGGAYGESVNVTPLGLATVTSGPLPSVTLPAGGGGPITANALSATAGSFLTTGVLQVSTQGATGAAGFAQSSAAVNDTNALNGLVTASVIRSSCRVDGASQTGSTTLLTAVVNGNTVPVNPAPNTVITIPGVGTVTLNEQIDSGGPGNFSKTVNAIHIHLTGPAATGDIIISQSRCREAGPNVTIPVAPIGILGVTAMLGATFGIVQRRRRHRGGSGPSHQDHVVTARVSLGAAGEPRGC